MKYLVFFLIPILVQGQDCGYLFLETKYQSFPNNYQLTVGLSDECDFFRLIIDEQTPFSIRRGIDTIILENNIIAPLLRLLDQIDVDDLNSLGNSYLLDGLLIDYCYVTRQEKSVVERLHFPIMNVESLLYMEDELKLLQTFQRLFKQYMRRDQIKHYEEYVQSMIYETN